MDLNSFYVHLGRLLYSVALADGAIHRSEVDKFHKILRNELVPLEDSEDAYGTDNAYYAEFELERLIDEGVDKNEAFTSFIMFMEEHSSAFDSNLKNLCIQTARKIAEAHAGVVPAESKMLKELEKKIHDQA
ncbi:MAG: TerB family tellurite resistance protein [Bacteroidales bacterium]|nr:TerB family tellurite resistance protein [Bacteroidales bacterium]MCF8334521.1 TerB family tellurite resistance protein [Bacteroidales bacterium]